MKILEITHELSEAEKHEHWDKGYKQGWRDAMEEVGKLKP